MCVRRKKKRYFRDVFASAEKSKKIIYIYILYYIHTYNIETFGKHADKSSGELTSYGMDSNIDIARAFAFFFWFRKTCSFAPLKRISFVLSVRSRCTSIYDRRHRWTEKKKVVKYIFLISIPCEKYGSAIFSAIQRNILIVFT